MRRAFRRGACSYCLNIQHSGQKIGNYFGCWSRAVGCGSLRRLNLSLDWVIAVTYIYLVRHGKAAAGWGADADPGLDDIGRAQAMAVAQELDALTGGAVVPILSSPLKRCQETAQPLASLWGQRVALEPRVAEIPSPTPDLEARTVWLRRVMAGTWDALDADPESATHEYAAWRRDLVAALMGLHGPTAVVVFSHFIAINVAYSAATGDARVVAVQPDNCAVMKFQTDGTRLHLRAVGREAETKVN